MGGGWIVAAAAAVAVAAVPDFLPIGHREVRHEMVLEAGGVPAGMRLVAAPMRRFHGMHVVEAGEPFPFSSKYGTRLYLLPADRELPAKWERSWVDAHPCSSRFREVSSAPVGTPLARVLTTWRIVAVTERSIELELVKEERFDAGGKPLWAFGLWIWPALAGACGAGWLLWLSRRPARAIGAAAPVPAANEGAA